MAAALAASGVVVPAMSLTRRGCGIHALRWQAFAAPSLTPADKDLQSPPGRPGGKYAATLLADQLMSHDAPLETV